MAFLPKVRFQIKTWLRYPYSMTEVIVHPMLLKLDQFFLCRTGLWCRLTLVIADQFYSHEHEAEVNRKTALLVKDKWQKLHLYFKIFRSATRACYQLHHFFLSGLQELQEAPLLFSSNIMSYSEPKLLNHMNKNRTYSLFQYRELISCSNPTNNQQFPKMT